MSAKHLTSNPVSGTYVGGSASELIGFHGVSPTAQVALSATAAVATTAAAHVSAGVYGFSLAQANGIVSLINALRAALVTKGLAST